MVAIHNNAPALTLRAGTDAIAHLREYGLRAGDVDIVPGAAGGPKALGINGLDQAVFGDFLPCLLYTSPSPRDRTRSRMPSSA